MKHIITCLPFIFILFSCSENSKKQNQNNEGKAPYSIKKHQTSSVDKIIHYSALDAMRNGVYTGDLTISEVKQNGDFGLGTYNLLDGEMVVLNGVFYRIKTNGEVVEVSESKKTPFNALTFFNPEIETKTDANTLDQLKEFILGKLPTKNNTYAIQVNAVFEYIELGGAEKIDKDNHLPVAEILKTRPIYKHKNVQGKLVGFYYPGYLSPIDLHPFHFHFLSNDKKIAGHLIDAKLSKATILLDEKESIEIVMPQTKDFRNEWKYIEDNTSKSNY